MKRPSINARPKNNRRKLRQVLRKARKKPKRSKTKAHRLKNIRKALSSEKPTLRPFQREGVDWLKRSKFRCLLADSQGTGKTVQALVSIGENAKEVCPVLVVCPSSVVLNWEKEAFRWLGSKLRCHVIEGMSDQFPLRTPHITVVSWDLLVHRCEELSKIKWRCVFADEIHYAKNALAKRTQAIHAILDACECEKIVLMSGTPLVNNEEEFQAVKDIAGGNVPMLRRVLEDVAPDIPPKTRIMLPVALHPDLEREYAEVKNEFEEWLEYYLQKVFGDTRETDFKLESILKAQHLAKLSYLRRIVARGKIPAAAKLAAEMVLKKKEPIVVFGEHNDILDLFSEALQKFKIPIVRLDGTSSKIERDKAIEAFQEGRVDVFLGSRAAFEGITLVRAKNAIFLERFFTPSAEEQAEDRIRRIGQKFPTYIWYLQAEGTIDERIEEIVERKRRIVRRVIGQPIVEQKTLDRVYLPTRNRKILDSVKMLKDEPTISLSLPRTPSPKYLRGILFDAELWSIPIVQKVLKKRGHQIKDQQIKGNYTFIVTRTKESFDRTSIKVIDRGNGFLLVVGRPASNSKRVTNYR